MEKEYDRTGEVRHNALMKKGWDILNKYVRLLGREPKKIGFFGKYHLKKAIRIYHEALSIVPDNYSSKWALGKIYQFLGNHNSSLKWFEEAWILEKENADICREASLAALNLGDFQKALKFCDKAISALLLNFYHKKQENHAAIPIRFSIDAANNALKALVNFIPLIVI